MSRPLRPAGGPDPRRPEPFDRADLVALLACLVFLVAVGSRLGSLAYNFDEAVNIHHAYAIGAGETPFVDFFYHQPPLYPLTLAAFASAAPESLPAYRLLSLLATALTGLLTFRIARRLLPPAFALCAALLLWVTPVQYFGLVALPNALMVALSTAGLLLVFFRRGYAATAAGGVLLALAILYKPLAVATALAAAGALLAARDGRRLLVLALAGGATGAGGWLALHLWSGGVFSDLLALQLTRYAGKSGFALMASYPPFADLVQHLEIGSAVGWNLYEHRRTFLTFDLHACTHVALLAGAGQVVLGSRFAGALGDRRILLTLWWLLPVLFAVFVWEPSWDHYFVQYLPPLAILAALFLHWLWSRVRLRPLARAGVLLAVAYATAVGVIHLRALRRDFDRLPRAGSDGEVWLTFDPFLNFVSGTRPACGVFDPFNVYGPHSLTGIAEAPLLSRFHVDRQELIDCLEADREIRIALGYWATWFVDEELRRFLDALPPERFVAIPTDLVP